MAGSKTIIIRHKIPINMYRDILEYLGPDEIRDILQCEGLVYLKTLHEKITGFRYQYNTKEYLSLQNMKAYKVSKPLNTSSRASGIILRKPHQRDLK